MFRKSKWQLRSSSAGLKALRSNTRVARRTPTLPAPGAALDPTAAEAEVPYGFPEPPCQSTAPQRKRKRVYAVRATQDSLHGFGAGVAGRYRDGRQRSRRMTEREGTATQHPTWRRRS